MKYYGKAEEAANRLLHAFETGNLPQALAQVFLRRKDDVPCRQWSWNNQLMTALMGYSDARGFQQWQEVGRQVRKGEKAFAILAPLMTAKKGTDSETGEETAERSIYGFKGIPVFGYEQTEGEPLPEQETDAENWIATLPLLEVAQSWGLTVNTYAGRQHKPLGHYVRGRAIAVGVENLATWAHELIHAADDRNGTLKERAQHWRSEVVAELGGAVLLECLGLMEESDRGGCWQYVRQYAEGENKDPLMLCGQVSDRVCRAVARLLEEAEGLQAQGEINPCPSLLLAGEEGGK